MSVVNPFEGPYGPATDAINAVLTAQVKDVFGYRTFSQSDLLFPGDEKAHIRQLDVRAGAGATPLGYASGKAGRAGLVGIIAPSYSLPYFHRALAQAGDSRVVLNVGALGYDSESGAVTNDYVTALDSAAKLGYGVVTPVSTKEVAATTLLTVAVSKFAKARGAVHLSTVSTTLEPSVWFQLWISTNRPTSSRNWRNCCLPSTQTHLKMCSVSLTRSLG